MKPALLLFMMILCGGTELAAQETGAGEALALSTAKNTEAPASSAFDTGSDLAPWFVRKYQAQGGLFIPFNNTNVRVDGNGGRLGTDIDFENDLGYKTYNFSAFASFQWHISRRSRLNLSYFYLGRSSTHTLDKNINFKDTTFPVSASVTSYFNTHIARIYYGYSILSKPKYEAGVLIGSHVLKVDLGLALNTSVGQLAYDADFKFTAPLPDLGVFGGYAITDQWAVNAEASYLSARIGNVDGRIISYNLSVQYNPLPYLGFLVSYTGLDFRLDVERNYFNGHIKWGYNGPSLTATYMFGRHF